MKKQMIFANYQLPVRKSAISFLTFLLLVGNMTGCGSSKYADTATTSSYDASYESGYDTADSAYEYEESTYGFADSEMKSSDDDSSAADTEVTDISKNSLVEKKNDKKKIIKRYSYDYETESFDDAYAYLKRQIEAYQGYVSESEIQGTNSRSLNLTARIPAEVSDDFAEEIGEIGTLISQSESAEDVTLEYTDTESRIASLKTEQKRLNELVEQADSLDVIIALEDRLTEVRYQLESYEGKKNLYDDLVAYSTVSITLREVNYTVVIDDSTLFSKIKTGLESSFRDIKTDLENFIVWFIVSLPYLLIWAAILFFIFKIAKRLRRRRKEHKERKKWEKEECAEVLGKGKKVPEEALSYMDEVKEKENSEKQKK